MIETIISGLALAVVSGLTFVAYKHPDGYKRIVKFIGPVCLLYSLGYALF